MTEAVRQGGPRGASVAGIASELALPEPEVIEEVLASAGLGDRR